MSIIEYTFYDNSDNPYPETGIFNFSINPNHSLNPMQEADEYRKSVMSCLSDPETIEEMNAWSNEVVENRKFMRRIRVKSPSDIAPRIMELSAESRFQADYAQYTADPEKWIAEHKGLDFEHYWEMMYRACLIAQNGFVEY